jgi:hypothetical protein
VGEPWGIDVAYQIPAVSLPAEEEVPEELGAAAKAAEQHAGAHLSRVIQALRLVKTGRLSAIGRMTIADDGVLSGRSIQFTNTRFPRPPYDSYDFDEEAGERLRPILAMLEDAAVLNSPALQTAVRRFSSSIERHDAQDRLLDLIISAEALFAGDSDPGDLSLRVAQRFARFLSPSTGVGVMELFQHMKLAYGGRSKIVHALARTAKVERQILRSLEALDRTEEFMRIAIVQALADTVARGEFGIDWNRLVLEGWGPDEGEA